MVYFTRRLVLILAWCYLVFLSIAITSLGEERTNLSAFRTFVRFALVWFCLFPLSLGIWEGLWFVTVALPGLSYTFCMLRFCFIKCSSNLLLSVFRDYGMS